ncbi:putative nuclease HARBI1 [Haliotis rubra]|uniref:putative nuclease HARBI1 n=1 Tax=Haliotis rubra TaxID=36100 RepID=UPI001EE53E60|nr:putative nuclease HARBI1 [Haliotis rubra]
MDKVNFDILLEKNSPYIEKKCTPMRNSIPVGEKLALTLRYLASGDSYSSLEFLYRVPRIPSVTLFLVSVKPSMMYFKKTTCRFLLLNVTGTTFRKNSWQSGSSPHCIGAIDGKHIAIRAPNNTGSEFFNYKKFFSIILLALVDANCKFIFVDVGANGRAGDAAVYANSQLSYALQHNTLNIPQPTPLEGRHELVPSVVVGDDAFQLKPHLMKPYPMRDLSYEKRIFNYRLSRARRVSENAFGLLVNRFCIFQKPLQVSPEVASSVVLASVALHNFLKSNSDPVYNTNDAANVHSVIRGFIQQGGNRNASNAREVRDELADYFMTEGQVDWQWDMVV